jgi:hypothetical protein
MESDAVLTAGIDFKPVPGNALRSSHADVKDTISSRKLVRQELQIYRGLTYAAPGSGGKVAVAGEL